MADIFISYASADRDRARLLADALANRGYSVWWDRTIPPGRVFDEVIQEAIQGARCVIVLWSAESVRSNWVKTEAAEGAARGILLPALIAEVAPPIEFKRIQSANLSAWEGDETQGEYRNLLDAVEQLMKQTPPAAGKTPAGTAAYRVPPPSTPSRISAIKAFGLGAVFALLGVGAYWLFGKAGSSPVVPSPAASTPAPVSASAPAPATVPASPASGAAPATAASPAGSPSRGRVNLLSAEHGGQLLVASADDWKLLIDGKDDTGSYTHTGFGVFGFRDGRSALIDTFTVLIPKQYEYNLKDFELFAGNASPTGPFESIGRFRTQNMRMMQSPYQEFRFPPVKAKYFKLQSLRSHEDGNYVLTYEIQLFGVLQ